MEQRTLVVEGNQLTGIILAVSILASHPSLEMSKTSLLAFPAPTANSERKWKRFDEFCEGELTPERVHLYRKPLRRVYK
eukprot:156399-Prorocentrum_minimum.AAC.3